VGPRVVDVKLYAVKAAVLVFDHHRVIAGVHVAGVLGDRLEVRRRRSEQSGVAVAGESGDLQHRAAGQRSVAGRVSDGDALSGRRRVEVYIQVVGKVTPQRAQITNCDDVALAQILLQDEVELLHPRHAQVGIHKVRTRLHGARAAQLSRAETVGKQWLSTYAVLECDRARRLSRRAAS